MRFLSGGAHTAHLYVLRKASSLIPLHCHSTSETSQSDEIIHQIATLVFCSRRPPCIVLCLSLLLSIAIHKFCLSRVYALFVGFLLLTVRARRVNLVVLLLASVLGKHVCSRGLDFELL